jgi:hypothetical protein
MKFRLYIIFCTIISIQFLLLLPTDPLTNLKAANAAQLELFQALMCEEILANAPRNPTIVFSITQKKAVCYSSFDPVPQKSVIYHNWFRQRLAVSSCAKPTLAPGGWKSPTKKAGSWAC